MENSIKSIRAFIGAKNYKASRNFYLDFGFKESQISADMSYFSQGEFGFYLQDYYAKDWVNNSMLFLEVQDVEAYLQDLQNKKLDSKHKGVRISKISYNAWGKEFFVHDPSGILWHIGSFSTNT
jgi:hypothetical protein